MMLPDDMLLIARYEIEGVPRSVFINKYGEFCIYVYGKNMYVNIELDEARVADLVKSYNGKWLIPL